jgi:hypothetical protein
MTALKVKESVATKPKNSIGETYARKVLSNRGSHELARPESQTRLGRILRCGAQEADGAAGRGMAQEAWRDEHSVRCRRWQTRFDHRPYRRQDAGHDYQGP